MTPTPPSWAEALLREFLTPADFESVSGDLLEEYRDSIRPARGESAADRWYVRQVVGFVWRSAGIWAALFAAAGITRTALDWFAPPVDFHVRSAVSTGLGVGLLLSAGLWASMRSGSFLSGTLSGVAATAIGALISALAAAGLLAIWHDAGTMAAIRGSGGLAEVFGLPMVMVVPGALLGTMGGLVGATIRRLRSA
jgi:hypothetical protein